MYKEHLTTSGLINDVKSLRKFTLGCWCRNKRLCHGFLLKKLACREIADETADEEISIATGGTENGSTDANACH